MVPGRIRRAGRRKQSGLAAETGDRRSQRRVAVVFGYRHRRLGHEDLVQEHHAGRMASYRIDACRNGVDRRAGSDLCKNLYALTGISKTRDVDG